MDTSRRTIVKGLLAAGALPLFNIGCAGFGAGRARQIAKGAKVRIAIANKYEIPKKERRYMSAIDPKGLTAAVLATQAAAFIPDPAMGFFIRNIVFSVILFSIVINSILIPLIARERRRYRFERHESSNPDVAD